MSKVSQGNYSTQSPNTDTSSYYGRSFENAPLGSKHQENGSGPATAHRLLQNKRQEYTEAYINQFRTKPGTIDAWGNIKKDSREDGFAQKPHQTSSRNLAEEDPDFLHHSYKFFN